MEKNKKKDIRAVSENDFRQNNLIRWTAGNKTVDMNLILYNGKGGRGKGCFEESLV